ncbi:hypothetical protein BDR03DRAFT_1017048 [Suillus americanus]|nr:hypothetical protein BDR03DRAFT_1017048 [Suillus americanus]
MASSHSILGDMGDSECLQTADFRVIQYDPTSTHPSAAARTTLPAQEFTTSQSHRLHPYSHSPSMTTTHKKPRKKICLSDLDSADRPAVAWARSRMMMDLVATVGWTKNETQTEKISMDTYVGEVVAQANILFQRRVRSTAGSIRLVLFGNSALEKTHLATWYGSKFTPFCDMSMRAEIKTTMPLMLSETAAATQCAIDRLVEGHQSGSKNILRFSAKKYAPQQAMYHTAISEFLADPVHKEPLEARFLDLHQRGLITDEYLGLTSPSRTVYVSMTREDLVRPLPQSSSGAQMQMPVHEGSQYLTGHHTDSAQEASSMAEAGMCGSIDEQLRYLLKPDETVTPDTIIQEGMFAYGLF